MAYYTIQLSANKAVVVPVAGRVILVDDLGAAPGIDIMPNHGGRDLPNMPNRKKAFKFSEPFDSVTLKTTVDATVGIFLSKNDVSLGFADGAAVSVSGQVIVSNTAAARVPVDLANGTVNVNAVNVGINNSDANPVPIRTAPCTQIVNVPAVAVGTVAAQISNDATLRRLRVRNDSATQIVGLGGAGIDFANAAIKLQPGDTFYEDDAAGAAWYAVADSNGGTVTVMGLK